MEINFAGKFDRRVELCDGRTEYSATSGIEKTETLPSAFYDYQWKRGSEMKYKSILPVVKTRKKNGIDWNRPKQSPGSSDCLRHCIAAVLQIPVEDVPDFVGICRDTRDTYIQLQAWLNIRGYYFIHAKPRIFQFWLNKNTAYPTIVGGPPVPNSKDSDECHACVVVDEKIVYDPGPSERGLTSINMEIMLIPTFEKSRLCYQNQNCKLP
jgi:hypothetical protein